MLISRSQQALACTWLRAALTSALLLATSAFATGCCGAAAVPTPDNGYAMVDSDGVVIFDAIAVGDTARFDVPIKDTADMDETLMGATITGIDADAFEVNEVFPIDMPAGTMVHVGVIFHPVKQGDVSAVLDLDTENMGVSPITLTGTGE